MNHEEFKDIVNDIVSKTEKILGEYPLCSICLGRMFAKYGVGLGNYERGLTLGTLLALKLYMEYMNKVVNKEYFKRIAINAGNGVASTYRKVFNENVEPLKCYICSNLFTRNLLEEIAREACNRLVEHDARTFIIGVSIDKNILDRELEILVKYGFSTAESIRREIKREIGKLITNTCGLQVDFSNPDVVVLVDLSEDFKYNITLQANSLFYKAYYWKLARRISHIPWYTRNKSKKYSLSIQETIDSVLREVFEADEVIIHAAGREDVDARMLGVGRPLVIEVKNPKKRRVDLATIRERFKESPLSKLVRVEVISTTSKSEIKTIKEFSGKKRKIYRVAIYSENEITQRELRQLEEFFNNREVHQRTPIRILRRKKDKERVRRVYGVKTTLLSNRVFEALIYCDGGLYIKELVHGDMNRTNPSFTSILGKKLTPLELDVIYVET